MILRSRKWRAATLTLAVLAVGVGGNVWRYWKPINTYLTWQYERLCHASTDRDNYRRALARGRFAAGDSVDALIAAHQPTTVTAGGRYVEVRYKTPGSTEYAYVVAKDGRLVKAWMNGPDEGEIELFDTLPYPDYLDYLRMLLKHTEEHRRQARMAVLGVAATIEP